MASLICIFDVAVALRLAIRILRAEAGAGEAIDLQHH
jgi:hypothetical protein